MNYKQEGKLSKMKKSYCIKGGMSMMKPIQATPELGDIDFAKVLNQTKSKPTAQAMKKNNMLHGVLINIRKK